MSLRRVTYKRKKKGSTLMIQVSWTKLWNFWKRYKTLVRLCKTKRGPFFESACVKNKSSLHIFISIVVLFAKLQTLPKPCIAGRGNRGCPPVCLHPEQIRYVGADHKASCNKRIVETDCTYSSGIAFCCCCLLVFSWLRFPTLGLSWQMPPAGKLTSET